METHSIKNENKKALKDRIISQNGAVDAFLPLISFPFLESILYIARPIVFLMVFNSTFLKLQTILKGVKNAFDQT